MFSFRNLFEAVYKGNIGIIELNQFFAKAKNSDPELYKKVKELIKQNDSKAVWKIVQDYLNVRLIGK